jgi:hypothetical protein
MRKSRSTKAILAKIQGKTIAEIDKSMEQLSFDELWLLSMEFQSGLKEIVQKVATWKGVTA